MSVTRDDVFPGGSLSMLVGRSGVGKTTLSYQLLRALATGEGALMLAPTDQRLRVAW